MYRGSRKHVLDWTARPEFTKELMALLPAVPIEIAEGAVWMPRGPQDPAEARLETFGPAWIPSSPIWDCLRKWWLQHESGANTPNWDIAVGCRTEGRPGLVLVEAKANWPELSKSGKSQDKKASKNSRDNHDHIGKAIDEACAGWRKIDWRIAIKRDSHYQLANRLAFTWKLATLGIPVVLIYLGFIGDEGIRADAGAPFSDDQDWKRAFSAYVSGTIPIELFGRRIDFGPTPVWLASISRAVLEQSPPLAQ